MPQATVPALDVTRYATVRNSTGADIAANLVLVPDATGPRSVKVPTTNSVPTAAVGISYRTLPAGRDGEAVLICGDIGVGLASGTIT